MKSHSWHKMMLLIVFLFTLNMAMENNPDVKTVRVFYIQPNDIPLDSAYLKGISKVMKSSQMYFLNQCKFTFRLNDPVCEVVKGKHPRSWYENNACGSDRYWCAVDNGQQDLLDLVPSVRNDANRTAWKIVFYIDAEGNGAGGGGGGGWVLLPKHDADGARGFPKDTARWCGGMCHELGHCFGLPDATQDDGTVMSADFYHWPVNCIFTADQTKKMQTLAANSGFWVNSITPTSTDPVFKPAVFQQRVESRIQNNTLIIQLRSNTTTSVNINIFDLSGKRQFIEPQKFAPKLSSASVDISTLKNGSYICSFDINGVTEYSNILIKH
jgi:Secretion system C-terminal sorting domain/Putative peptidase family